MSSRIGPLLLTTLLLAPATTSGGATSGVQVTRDGRATMVNKDVDGQRWSILRSADGTVTGNVFFPDGRSPQFVWCVAPGDDAKSDGERVLSCFGADACTGAPCVDAAWTFLADVSLPESFFEPPATGWRTLASLAGGPRQEHAVLAFQDEIWVFGGFDGRVRVVDTIEIYDPKTDSWRDDVAPLPVPMHHANVSVVDGRIWVTGFLRAGGFQPDGRVFSYDPAADRWSEGTPMPAGQERGASAVAAIGGKIYVAGGLAGGTRAEVSVYDPATDAWTTLAPLPQPLDHAASATVDGVLYVLGGRSDGIEGVSPAVWGYDPREDRWTRGADLPTPRGGVAGAVVGGRIFVLGGEGNPEPGTAGVFDDVEAYDPAGDTWEILPPMRVPRHGMGAAGLGSRVYVPGGATSQAFGAVATCDALETE